MNPRPPDPTSDPAAPPITASGAGGDTNPHRAPAPAAHNFLSPPEAPDEIGRLGPYRILAELGRGGMGVVFRAEDTVLRRQVALKVMLPDVATDARAVARFLREARAQAAVEHEHVAVIHVVGQANGVPFIALPLLKGQTLAAALKQNARPPLGELVRIGREMAEGLAASHEKGLIHRDIKPANVWLDGPKRRVRILDFGLARNETAAGDDEQLTGRGAILGTPAYMSPEQAKGEPVDHRSDLFSLGVVLYEMATGKKPFAGANTLAVLFAVAEHQPPAAHQTAPDVPLPLSELIWRLMAKGPPDRPASAAAVASELEAFESGLSTSHVQVLPIPTAVAQPSGPDPWAELTIAPDGTEEDDEETEYDEPPVRPTPAGVPRWVWPAVGAAVLLAVAAGVWVAMPPRPKAVADAVPEPQKATSGGSPKPPQPKDNLPAPPNPPAVPNVPAPAAPVLTAENRAALEWVLANGGQLLLYVGPKEVPIPPRGKLPDDPFTVAGVSFIGANVPDDAPERLAAAPRVQRGLGLNRATFTDATLAKLLALPCFTGISHLSLAETRAGDAALIHVAKLPALTTIDLAQAQVTDAGLARLRGLKLTNISLHMCPVTNAGMDHLADMTSLTHLWLMSTGVTDAGFAKLTKLTNLVYLQPGTITDAGVETLLSFRRLNELYLIGTKVTAAGLKRLAALPITQLILSETSITDADLAVLQDFPALGNVALNNNKERITDAGLKHLAECPGLRNLNLLDTRVTDDGVKALSAKLPLCGVLWGADQQIRPKPLDEVLRASVAELLRAGVGVSVTHAGMDRGRPLKTAAELKDGERVRLISIGPPWTAFTDPAVMPALRAFPAEGWDAPRAQLALGRGITAEQFRAVTRLPGTRPLRSVELYNVELSDAELAHLSNLPACTGVSIVETPKLTAVGCGHLTAAGVRHLRLSDMTFDPRVLAELRGVYGLSMVQTAAIGDAALEHLAPLADLRALDLKETKVTKAGVEKLAAALPRCKIIWDGGAIEPRSALGYGLEFDGTSSYVTFPTLKYDGSHPLTFEMWVKSDRGPTGPTQFLLSDIEQAGIGLYLKPEGDPVEWMYGALIHTGGAYRRARHGTPAGSHPLTHLAVVYDGRSQIRLFVDGKLKSTGEAPGAFKPSGLAMMFGANPGGDNKPAGEFFEGTLTWLRVSKSARYVADFVPRLRLEPDPDTLAVYRCEDDAGDVLTDGSGNNRHGKIVGAKWAAATEGDVAANRRGAEKLIPYASLTVRLPGGQWQMIEPNQPLPAGPFTVTNIYVPPGKWPDKFVDDVFLSAMADLRSVFTIQSQPWILMPTAAQLERLAALPAAQSLASLMCGFELSAGTLDALKRFPRLEAVRCRNEFTDDATLERLAELPGLNHLSLTYLGRTGKVTARGAAALAKLPVRHIELTDAPAAPEYLKHAPNAAELTGLSLWGSPITDADVRHLSGCWRLEGVTLDATGVTDAGLKHLEGLHRLRGVSLVKTKVTEAGAKALAKALPRCKIAWDGGAIEPNPQPDRAAAEWLRALKRGVTIRAGGAEKLIPPTDPLPDGPWELAHIHAPACPQLTDGALAIFEGCRNVAAIDVHHNRQITDAGVAHLRGLTEIRKLVLDLAQVTDAGLENFKGCTKLEELNLRNTRVTDAGLKHFAGCAHLKQALLWDTAVGDAGIATLKECGDIWVFWLANTRVTDAGLEHLAAFPKLRVVTLQGTKVTEAGVKKLAAALPNCRIEWDGGVIEPRK